jgi:hypothetical protein
VQLLRGNDHGPAGGSNLFILVRHGKIEGSVGVKGQLWEALGRQEFVDYLRIGRDDVGELDEARRGRRHCNWKVLLFQGSSDRQRSRASELSGDWSLLARKGNSEIPRRTVLGIAVL